MTFHGVAGIKAKKIVPKVLALVLFSLQPISKYVIDCVCGLSVGV